MIRQFALLLMLAVLCFVLLPTKAQESGGNGRGVVTIADPDGSCAGGYCSALVGLVLPTFFDTDPETGALVGADASQRVVVRALPHDLPAAEMTLELADRQWSDGQPITAYDALFTLMSYYLSEQDQAIPASVLGARVVDEQTLVVRFTETPAETPRVPTCDALPRTNAYLLPYHAYMPGFREFADQYAPEGDIPSLDDWWEAYDEAGQNYPYRVTDDLISSGAYRAMGDSQFVPVDGTGAALRILTALPEWFARPNTIDALIAGETNVLLDVPVSERPGLRLLADANARNFQIAEVPGFESLIVVLNFGDPARPLPGIHPETGEIVDQGQHPIFSDPAVRRALQLALDPDALIDGVMQRSAMPLAGLYPPSSWAFDPTLAQLETNAQEAKRLLEEAGWKEYGSARTCQGCATAEEGTTLQFALGSSSDDTALAEQIAQQWQRIGVLAYASGEAWRDLTSQTFDAYLTRVGGAAYEDADPDRTLMLTPAGDMLNTGGADGAVMNYGSYNNPEVTALLEQARTLPGCDLAERAAIYHQLERVLQDDVPFLAVAAPTEFYAAAPNILGFAPRTGDPLWNVESWVVAS